MILITCIAYAAVTLSSAKPLYGQDGGYEGFSSYRPLKNSLQDSSRRSTKHSEDSFHALAGSPDISRRPLKKGPISSLSNVPKKYNTLGYRPSYQKDDNKVSHDVPHEKTTLYGQRSGYKLADAYPNQHLDIKAQGDYGDEYLSPPKPYEYGYALKDGHGNTQHRKESSDVNGKVHGSYGYTDEHGVYRTVQYVADKEGFRASVKTNEPGTDSQDPADVRVKSENINLY
ncbi:hypothetical protein JTE90_001920 [Oedothorax gibbosus]|uniref:Cuticle protein n=1 Tax=Oedothorax gibbosus TaxID=931172 RepID=A0AAV6VVG8_9ARAC|nr:hypothetical protein JTE90_001920 [Oedothorax gibbosus]